MLEEVLLLFLCVWDRGGVTRVEQFAWDWCTAYCSASGTTWLLAVSSALCTLAYWAAVGAELTAAPSLSRANVEKLKAAKSCHSYVPLWLRFAFFLNKYKKKKKRKKPVQPVFVNSRRTSCLSYLLCFPWLWQSLQHPGCPGSRAFSKLD